MPEGLLVKINGGFYYAQGDGLWELKMRGRLRHGGAGPGAAAQMSRRRMPGQRAESYPLVGDRIVFTPTEVGRGVIESVLPRRNTLTRPRVANIDQAVLIFALANPEPDLALMDRLLVWCCLEQVEALICFNKTDLIDRPAAGALAELYGRAGYRSLCTSALQGTGLDALRLELKDKISVLAGPSGAGKSTIINVLEPGLAQDTGELSRKLKRGRHTTRHVELLPVAGGLVADTPGFSNLELPFLELPDLAGCFPEIQALASQCRFLDCLHRSEPDCAVKEALGGGLIDTGRYQHYLSFLTEVSLQERRC